MSQYGVNNLIGNEQFSNKVRRTQVFQATHEREGDENRLPFMKRSFISFTYGGKYIEDFGLIAITENNSIDRKIYSEFTDQTTDLEIVDGQLYWGSHFGPNKLDLTLFTDEITERQLTSFQQWFKPGFARELILAEHPNRVIMARVAQPPEYHMLPFEKKITSSIFNLQTSTTVYKGKINISFIMDDPFWYSRINAIAYDSTRGWYDFTKGSSILIPMADVAKFVEEDGLPVIQAISGEILIGQPLDIDSENSQRPARTWGIEDPTPNSAAAISIVEITVGMATIGGRAVINQKLETECDIEEFLPGEQNAKYFFYGGTAPGTPHIKFTIENLLNIRNKYNTAGIGNPYNTIVIESVNKQEFKITTPSIITAYYQAKEIMDNVEDENEKLALLRDSVNHYFIRNYVIQHNALPNFENSSITFDINCKTGETIITTTIDGDFSEQESNQIIENGGDAIKSRYLKIEDRNYPDNGGFIQPWSNQNKEYSYKIYHDFQGGLKNVFLRYKYLYL